eukprot:2599180-Rhodomonas_salina.1
MESQHAFKIDTAGARCEERCGMLTFGPLCCRSNLQRRWLCRRISAWMPPRGAAHASVCVRSVCTFPEPTVRVVLLSATRSAIQLKEAYEDYLPLDPHYYLNRTAFWAAKLARVPSDHPKPEL